ncbi:hypothetical protein [Thermoactinomyces sp. DSM 45892]|uniref:hypothetical protein n=1 Tax=Thermoactinomyces sp. DSM 45892 TaxID=1882753 RepID=UPI000895E5AC|nr:hypothetical protein [Thermoactinomyces sp. DSM 45892]SDY22733.1 hypothetical protein SAMN05444416_10333 [Thermoactinomyces sp. DSM 45892]
METKVCECNNYQEFIEAIVEGEHHVYTFKDIIIIYPLRLPTMFILNRGNYVASIDTDELCDHIGILEAIIKGL